MIRVRPYRSCLGLPCLAFLVAGCTPGVDAGTDAPPPAPVLSVALTHVHEMRIPERVAATGDIVAWQEAVVGAVSDGMRIVDVRADIGDRVTRGDVLVVFDASIVQAELAEAVAAVAQAEAEASEADANAARARRLEGSGALSVQQVLQQVVAATTARARLEASRAVAARHRLRLAHARVLAPDDGIVMSRTATIGAVAPAGTELLRIIRKGRLEWRAEVAFADMARLAPGQEAVLEVPGHGRVRGRLRLLAPVVGAQTRNGMAYIDLPAVDGLRTGTFASGHIVLGDVAALTVPRSAVLLREGFHYVLRVGARSEVQFAKVAVGRQVDDRVEITRGLVAAEPIIASGVAFLAEGDIVDVVQQAITSSQRRADTDAASSTRAGP
ncbi:efflux RND transporter periplasmic adaptor subunit [Dokdonella sp. MW10]|uniref:efflux RND transporter periplasmic adaptor subunit n=1 Tax=Dokdonella sp. MW10 TaxID=2992926 RepID=UPI003F7EBEF5